MKNNTLRKVLSLLVIFNLISQQAGFAQGIAQLDISKQFSQPKTLPGTQEFRPVHLRSFSYDALTNNFQILLDKGSLKNIQDSQIKTEGQIVMKYLLIGIALPDKDFWVNLRPDSQDQIIEPALAKTDLGKVLLEADLQLKKDVAKFTSPETTEGRAYWNALYKKAGQIFQSENIVIPTLTRPWIVPGEVIVRESGDSAYVYKGMLKVMLEQDHLKNSANYNFKDSRLKELNEYSSQIIRDTIIPKLTQEINSSKKYSALRQVFYSLILARWFKAKFAGKSGIYSKLINSGNLEGLTSQQVWSKDTYFKEYQKSFSQGEYNLKEKVSGMMGPAIRTYFSGGLGLTNIPVESIKGVNLDVNGALGRGNIVLGGSPISTNIAPDLKQKMYYEGAITAKDAQKIHDDILKNKIARLFEDGKAMNMLETESTKDFVLRAMNDVEFLLALVQKIINTSPKGDGERLQRNVKKLYESYQADLKTKVFPQIHRYNFLNAFKTLFIEQGRFIALDIGNDPYLWSIEDFDSPLHQAIVAHIGTFPYKENEKVFGRPWTIYLTSARLKGYQVLGATGIKAFQDLVMHELTDFIAGGHIDEDLPTLAAVNRQISLSYEAISLITEINGKINKLMDKITEKRHEIEKEYKPELKRVQELIKKYENDPDHEAAGSFNFNYLNSLRKDQDKYSNAVSNTEKEIVLENDKLSNLRNQLEEARAKLIVEPRKPFVGGNWKMALSTEEDAVRLLTNFAAQIGKINKDGANVETVIAPSPYHVSDVSRALNRLVMNRVLPGGAIKIAAQNMYAEESGAFTGGSSAQQLKASGVTHVILGHSELRRNGKKELTGESSANVNRKTKTALKYQLIPIVCVGESDAERSVGKEKEIVRDMVEESLMGISSEDAAKIIVAYEPVWEIGTGKTATPEQAEEMHSYIRSILEDMFGVETAAKIRILYGGSVTAEKAAGLSAQPNIDGPLVGGASLKPDDFVGIVKGFATTAKSSSQAAWGMNLNGKEAQYHNDYVKPAIEEKIESGNAVNILENASTSEFAREVLCDKDFLLALAEKIVKATPTKSGKRKELHGKIAQLYNQYQESLSSDSAISQKIRSEVIDELERILIKQTRFLALNMGNYPYLWGIGDIDSPWHKAFVAHIGSFAFNAKSKKAIGGPRSIYISSAMFDGFQVLGGEGIKAFRELVQHEFRDFIAGKHTDENLPTLQTAYLLISQELKVRRNMEVAGAGNSPKAYTEGFVGAEAQIIHDTILKYRIEHFITNGLTKNIFTDESTKEFALKALDNQEFLLALAKKIMDTVPGAKGSELRDRIAKLSYAYNADMASGDFPQRIYTRDYLLSLKSFFLEQTRFLALDIGNYPYLFDMDDIDSPTHQAFVAHMGTFKYKGSENVVGGARSIYLTLARLRGYEALGAEGIKAFQELIMHEFADFIAGSHVNENLPMLEAANRQVSIIYEGNSKIQEITARINELEDSKAEKQRSLAEINDKIKIANYNIDKYREISLKLTGQDWVKRTNEYNEALSFVKIKNKEIERLRKEMLEINNNLVGLEKQLKEAQAKIITGAVAKTESKNKEVPPKDDSMTPGGIDFSVIPMLIQPAGIFSGLKFNLPRVNNINSVNLDEEFNQMQKMFKAGIVLSPERLKEYLAACYQKGELKAHLDGIVTCLVDLCKLEEERVIPSANELKEMLLIVEAVRS